MSGSDKTEIMVVTTNNGKINTTIMEDKGAVKSTIQRIFETMEYGESFESTDIALEWLKTKEGKIFAYVDHTKEVPNGTSTQIKNCVNGELLCTVHIPEIDTIKKIASKTYGKIKWIDTKPYERAKALNRLAGEIEKNSILLSQIEIVSRGILGKDTRSKAIPLLAQYFYYYSSFAIAYGQENPNWKPEGIAVGVISNENILSNLGLVLAPALAAGYNILLQVGTKLSPSVVFILDLAKKAGIPEEVIRLVPSDDGELLPYLSNDSVVLLALLVDLHNEKYLGINSFNKKIIHLASYKTPLIVFEDADIDSASTSIIDSAWSYQSLLPWSVNTVLVQESIFDAFLHKLKSKLCATKIGLGNNKTVDIAYPSEESVYTLNNLIKLATSQGIEVFQAKEGANNFLPTLFIGAKVRTNRVLRADDDQEANVITVLPFRSIDEAVNLANNTRQGLAASVWSENIGVMNEVTRKLKVANIWINSHGLTVPEVTLSPIKDSGVGYFGGKDGFYEYVQIKKTSDTGNTLVLPLKLNSSIANTIIKAKKVQETWYKLPKLSKSRILQQFGDFIDVNKSSLSPNLNQKWLESWIANVYECITNSSSMQSTTNLHLGFNVTSLIDPQGVILIETRANIDLHNIRLILGALFEGNSVILLNECETTQSFYKELSQKFPNGVLNVVPYNLENVATVAGHKEVNAYFGEGVNPVYAGLPIKDSRVFINSTDNWAHIHRKVTVAKNIWSNIGKSSSCSLGAY